jgi:hypothetical protein
VAKPSVFATARLAFSDAIRAMSAMPALALAAVIVSGARALADWTFGLSLSETVLTGQILLLKLVVGVAYAILLAPVWIAIFRFIILDEVARGYALDLDNPRFRLFCAWSVVFFLLTEALGLVTPVLGIEGDMAIASDSLPVLAYFVVAAGLALLFPAIAVDAPGAMLANALADLRGSFWRVFGILWLIALPALAAVVIGLAMTDVISQINAVIGWLATLLFELVWTAAAARLFLVLASRLRSTVSR